MPCPFLKFMFCLILFLRAFQSCHFGFIFVRCCVPQFNNNCSGCSDILLIVTSFHLFLTFAHQCFFFIIDGFDLLCY